MIGWILLAIGVALFLFWLWSMCAISADAGRRAEEMAR
jgi:hypothetical protein